ncbi:MAG TPA: RNA polymerase subunit sigma-70 [Egibacteraceae bacterium]|nr:RNA polymerase subunit sigma-70 [Egibacteraceae bacterium]
MPVEQDELVTAAKAGDESAFGQLTERHRRELRVHCYRMLGSFSESEDLVQETLLRAWRGLNTFEGRSSFRAWLYRIATNACLDALSGRPRRLLPYDVAPPADPSGPPPEPVEYLALEPYPDHLLQGAGGEEGDPSEAVVAKETIELAFLAAIQHLSPRQRAVVILRDVLGWSAKDTAQLLDMTEVAVKSMLQRARPLMREHLPSRRQDWSPEEDPSVTERWLLQRYMEAHEQDNIEALAEVLRDDVRVAYPQMGLWSDSRESFIVSSRKFAPPGDYKFMPAQANLQPAVAIYLRSPGDTEFRLTALEVLRIDGDKIAEIVDFYLPDLFPAFDLPAVL